MIKPSSQAIAVSVLAGFARLQLTPRALSELAEAYEYVHAVLDRIPRDLDPSHEPAQTFDPRKFIPDVDQP